MDIGSVWENAFFNLKHWTPCQTQRSTIVLFWGIHFSWPIFIKFQGEPCAKKGNFLIKTLQKGPKNAFCGLFVLNFKQRVLQRLFSALEELAKSLTTLNIYLHTVSPAVLACKKSVSIGFD